MDTGSTFAVIFGRVTSLKEDRDKIWLRNDSVIDVACGDSHVALVTESGKLYTFGANEWGQLGLGHTKALGKPSQVKGIEQEKVTQAACGQTHTVIATGSCNVYTFGGSQYGQLGCGERQSSSSPCLVQGLPKEEVKMVSCGAFSTAVVTVRGRLFVWGSNSEGQLGIEEEETDRPVELNLAPIISCVACGNYHTVVLSGEGEVIVFGETEGGKLGLGGKADSQSVVKPTKLTDVPAMAACACGSSHTLLLSRDGCVYSCGVGDQGQLGMGYAHLESLDTPTPIEGLVDHKVTCISCGTTHSGIVSDLGKLFMFGDGRHGKLSHRQDQWFNMFLPLEIDMSGCVVKVACGGTLSVVLVRSMMEDRPLDQTINFSSHVPLKGESPSSSLSSTIHNYQGMLSLRSSSPSPPLSSLSASLSLSSSLPPLSLAREKRRQSKQRIKSSPLPPVTSESRLAQNPEPHEATDDESEVTVTDTDISDDDTIFDSPSISKELTFQVPSSSNEKTKMALSKSVESGDVEEEVDGSVLCTDEEEHDGCGQSPGNPNRKEVFHTQEVVKPQTLTSKQEVNSKQEVKLQTLTAGEEAVKSKQEVVESPTTGTQEVKSKQEVVESPTTGTQEVKSLQEIQDTSVVLNSIQTHQKTDRNGHHCPPSNEQELKLNKGGDIEEEASSEGETENETLSEDSEPSHIEQQPKPPTNETTSQPVQLQKPKRVFRQPERPAAQVADRQRTTLAKLAFWKKGNDRQAAPTANTTRSALCIIL